jgi:methylmalonyl-CoA mutase N-terminal domain/subunit
VLYVDETAGAHQAATLDDLRRRRDSARVGRALTDLRAAAASSANLMPPLIEAARVYATLGEMCDSLRDVWGEYEEVPVF